MPFLPLLAWLLPRAVQLCLCFALTAPAASRPARFRDGQKAGRQPFQSGSGRPAPEIRSAKPATSSEVTPAATASHPGKGADARRLTFARQLLFL